MLNFFKRFGMGILYTFTLPFLIAFLVLYAVYSLIIYLWLIIKGCFMFLSGHSFVSKISELEEAEKIREQFQSYQPGDYR